MDNWPEADNRKTPREAGSVDSSRRSTVRDTGHTGPRRRHPQPPTVRRAHLALAFLVLFALAFVVLSCNATVQAQTATNAPPEFADETADRSVPENSPPGIGVGKPVTATDADNDTLTYSISGTDAGLFGIDRVSGQITVGTGAVLNYETQELYAVTVTATDPSGASDTVTVAITVTNVGLDNQYDSNDNGAIEKNEILDAIDDYFDYDDRITKDEVLDIIGLYLFSPPSTGGTHAKSGGRSRPRTGQLRRLSSANASGRLYGAGLGISLQRRPARVRRRAADPARQGGFRCVPSLPGWKGWPTSSFRSHSSNQAGTRSKSRWRTSPRPAAHPSRSRMACCCSSRPTSRSTSRDRPYICG